jgi:SAM-dependent methyltransferase
MHWTDKFFDGPYDSQLKIMSDEDKERAANESEFIITQLGLTETDRVLDIGCGYGRHALHIAEQVKELVGFDLTQKYLDAARKSAEEQGILNISFMAGDMRKIDFDAEFDAAYNYFTAWGYWDDETNMDILRRICKTLKPGGRFLLEFMNHDALMRSYSKKIWRRVSEEILMLEENRFDCSQGRTYAKRTYITLSETSSNTPCIEEVEIDIKVPCANEFISMFMNAGFADATVVEAPTGNELTIDSWRIAVIGRKG